MSRLVDWLDKGSSLGPNAPCLVMDRTVLSYDEVQRFTHKVARGFERSGIAPGCHVAILSENHPLAFASVLGVSRAGAVWCPINPRNEVAENSFVLDAFDCEALIFQAGFSGLVEKMLSQLPKLRLVICLDQALPFAPSLEQWLDGVSDSPTCAEPPGPLAMIAGTGGTTGQPKGVMLSGANLEAMTALALIGFPYFGRPTYLAMAPLTHAAGVLAFPVFALGGQVVIMAKPDLGQFLKLIPEHQVTHTFLPPTLIYMLLDKPELTETDLSSLQCFWYGAAPMSAVRLQEALVKIGPVMGQFFGQTEAPMMVSTMAPRDHFEPNGDIAIKRLASAGKPGALVQVATIDADGGLLATGETGEIVVRGSLVMMGYYKNPEASAETTVGGWHRTGDIGHLDQDGYLFIVDRAKDMIITGGFNVYSAEVEQALSLHPAILDSAVVGLPDPKWGERVCAVVQFREGKSAEPADIIAAVKARIGSVKTPKSLVVWPDLPRSKVGKVLKKDVRTALMAAELKATRP